MKGDGGINGIKCENNERGRINPSVPFITVNAAKAKGFAGFTLTTRSCTDRICGCRGLPGIPTTCTVYMRGIASLHYDGACPPGWQTASC